MRLRSRLALAGAAGAAVLLVWVASSGLMKDGGSRPAATPSFTDWQFNPFAEGKPLDAVQHNADAMRSADAARARVAQVWQTGSLRGSDLDGDWGVWKDGQLQPSASLRRRFDYLLTALGEVSPTDLRHWIEQELSIERDSGAARQVLAVWDRYITLQQTSFKAQVNPNDPATFQPALAERVAARRQILGEDWARAFYADEEQTFVAFTEQRTAGVRPAEVNLLTAVAPSEQLQAQRVRQFGPEAADRLRAEDEAWADWERRLQAARQRVQAINAAPELSALQRAQAQEAHLGEAFSGSELVRAKSLLLQAP
jgi:lipase chaperone LimK